jgi:hypothetical protein
VATNHSSGVSRHCNRQRVGPADGSFSYTPSLDPGSTSALQRFTFYINSFGTKVPNK